MLEFLRTYISEIISFVAGAAGGSLLTLRITPTSASAGWKSGKRIPPFGSDRSASSNEEHRR
jgi:hypothetical protein